MYIGSDLGQEFAEPVVFNDMSNVTPEVIIKNMKAICEENEIPACFDETEVVMGGFFKKVQFRAVEVSHPNPPQSYCSQLYVIYNDGIRFFFVGSSAAFAERNNYEAAMSGTGGNFKAKLQAMAGIEPDNEPYEMEMEWHRMIYSAFEALTQ